MNTKERTTENRAIAVAGAVFIAALTLTPNAQDVVKASASEFFCLFCNDLSSVDAMLNVLLYVPFAFGLRLAGVPARRALAIAVACTVSVELLQLTVIPGRYAGLDDIMTNSLGAALGIFLAARWRVIAVPSPVQARRLALAGAAVWIALWSITAFLLEPSPPSADWWGQVPSQGVYAEDFKGTVTRAELNDVPLHSGRIANSPELRNLVVRDGVALKVEAVVDARTSSLAAIVAVLNQRHAEALVLGQRGVDLVFRTQLRAAPLGHFRVPAVRVPRAAATSGDTIRVSARLTNGVYDVVVTTRDQTTHRVQPVTPSWGWVFFSSLRVCRRRRGAVAGGSGLWGCCCRLGTGSRAAPRSLAPSSR